MSDYEGFYLMREKWPLPLDEETIRDLFRSYRAGNSSAKQKIFMHNIRFVKLIIYSQFRFPFSDNPNYSEDDLMQVGLIGLYRAIDDFDLSLNYKFITFAKTYIRREVGSFLKKQKKHYNVESLQKKIYDNFNTEDEIFLEDTVPCLSDFTIDIMDQIELQKIMNSFSCLNAQEKQVLLLYMGFLGSPLGYQKIGEIMKVSHTMVGNIYHSALDTLRRVNHVDNYAPKRKKSQKI